MKPCIIVIKRKHHFSQQNILRRLLARILSDIEGSDASIYPNELIKDFICIAQLTNMKIGIYEGHSTQSSFAHELDFFAYKSCDIIFCHTKMNTNLNKRLNDLHEKGHVDLIVFDNIWLDAISIKSLVDYEVEKLFELILIKAEKDETFLLTTNDIKQAKIS